METHGTTDNRLVELGAGPGLAEHVRGPRAASLRSGLELGSGSLQSPQATDFTPKRSEAGWTGLQHSLCRTYPLSLPRDDFQARISLYTSRQRSWGEEGKETRAWSMWPVPSAR